MSQNLNFSVAGLVTSLNDYQGLPPGALDVADNLEIRYKNVLEPRRGFEGLADSAMANRHFVRLVNFYVEVIDRVIGLTDEGDMLYYTGANPWPAVPGDLSQGLVAPDAVYAKSRFVRAGQNLYTTAEDGPRSLSSGANAVTLRAGVPKGLNLKATVNNDASGFFETNEVLSTTGDITSSSALVQNLDDTTGIEVGQFVGGTGIPAGTKVLSITPAADLIIQTGDTTAGSADIANLASNAGIVANLLVSGEGIPTGAKVVSISGGGPYTVTLDQAAFKDDTGVDITFRSPVVVTMDANATATTVGVALSFYLGSQVNYRMVFGRVETDINGTTITRVGSPSALAVATNNLSHSTNVTVEATLPKNSSEALTFFRLFRSDQSADADIAPLDQQLLVYERTLTSADFTARTVTVEDTVPDSLRGIPLYSGSDQEGILQSNDPAPACWDMCKFRDFILMGNITRPSTLNFSLVSVGAPSGVEVGDTFTVSGSFVGVSFNRTYTAATGEDAPNREFEVITAGTPSQNIADTADSLIRVINYDNNLPVHAILVSSATDLPGQMTLEADYPSDDTFFVTASGDPDAWDPVLANLESELNVSNNGIAASKSGEYEAFPVEQQQPCGDTSSNVLRVIPLRDYVLVIKTDGVYKVQGLSPTGLVITAFDLTVKIIGSDTAVALNSAVMMLSNQGVVNISDGGVDAKSIPIDDELNRLIGSYLDNLEDVAFAVAYESDRKYILCVPESDNPYAEVEYNFNYITQAWTTWSRDVHAGFIHSIDNKLYIARADSEDEGVSKERKTGTYTDYVDEALDRSITNVDDALITLNSTENVEVGDILYQTENLFSRITAVDLETNIVTVQSALAFTVAACTVLQAYACTATWKQVFGSNPAFARQFSEGMALFKTTRFDTATIGFVTDFSQGTDEVTLTGTGNALWGLFPWGELPWGGSVLPSKIRFLIPADKQLGSYIIPTLEIKQGYSDFKFQGMSISYYDFSQEVGK